MLLVHPYTWQKLKESGYKSDSVNVKENNENIIKEKIFSDNEKNKEWKNFGDRLIPIIKKSQEPTMPEIEMMSSPAEPSPPKNKEVTVVDRINENIPYNYRPKALRLYNMLQSLKEVDVTPENIIVQGKPLMGHTIQNISQLIRGNKYLSFNLSELLNVISEHSDIKSLIANQEAKKYMENKSPGLRSPLHSTPLPKRKDKSADDSSTFYDPDSTLSVLSPSTKEKKGGKKRRIIWKSLFDTYG